MKKTAMWLVPLVLAALLALVLWPRAEAAPDFALKDLHQAYQNMFLAYKAAMHIDI